MGYLMSMHSCHASDAVPGMNVILQSLQRLRLQIEALLTRLLMTFWMHPKDFAKRPGGRSWITCHCQGNLLCLILKLQQRQRGRKQLYNSGNWLHNILTHVSIFRVRHDRFGFLRGNTWPWSLFNFDDCYADNTINISASVEKLLQSHSDRLLNKDTL